jgi:hypothetical protein
MIAAFAAQVKSPLSLTAGGNFTMPDGAELFVVARTAVTGAVNFATARGVTYHLKDVALNGKAKLGYFEKGTVINFAPSVARSFDLHIRTLGPTTAKIASHL